MSVSDISIHVPALMTGNGGRLDSKSAMFEWIHQRAMKGVLGTFSVKILWNIQILYLRPDKTIEISNKSENSI